MKVHITQEDRTDGSRESMQRYILTYSRCNKGSDDDSSGFPVLTERGLNFCTRDTHRGKKKRTGRAERRR